MLTKPTQHPKYWQPISIDKAARARLKNQQAACVWLTGLPGAGKTTIANLLEQKLHAAGAHTFLLDGDNIRQGLNHDLGFDDADRMESIRRVAQVGHLMVQAGLIVIVSLISPFRAGRDHARSLFDADEFYEVFVDASIEVCIERDPKGLYAKACRGELLDFTGIDSPYEPPLAAEFHLNTMDLTPEVCAERLYRVLFKTTSGIPASRDVLCPDPSCI